MITLYDYLPSQNAYKVRLLLSHLQRPYVTKLVSIFEGEGRQADFLAKSPTGAVPVLELEDGRVLTESNAILTYLAEGTRYLPVSAGPSASPALDVPRGGFDSERARLSAALDDDREARASQR